MPDGRVNKCRECNKKDVKENRKTKADYYREYDRDRGNRQSKDYIKEWRKRFPKKYHAHILVGNAIRDGKILKQTCKVCGGHRVVAHHDDYDKPLEVRWLCQAHHIQWHKENGEGLNSL